MTRVRKQTPEWLVDQFNACPVGTLFEYRSYPGAEPQTVCTTSAAWVLSGHTAVVMVDGVSGAVAVAALRRPAAACDERTHYWTGDPRAVGAPCACGAFHWTAEQARQRPRRSVLRIVPDELPPDTGPSGLDRWLG